jgi:hypothetical protein
MWLYIKISTSPDRSMGFRISACMGSEMGNDLAFCKRFAQNYVDGI